MASSSQAASPGDKTEWVGAGVGIAFLMGGLWFHHALAIAGGVALCALSLACWRGWRWARWTYLAVLLAGAGLAAWDSFRGQADAVRVAAFFALLWLAWDCVKQLRRDAKTPPETEAKHEKPLVSLVLWERSPRYLDQRILAAIVGKVWPGDYSTTDEEAPCYVVGHDSTFIVRSPTGIYFVHNFDRSYFDDAESAAEDVSELRCRNTVVEHRAWLSVDLMEAFDGVDIRETVYPQIARLVTELAGPDTLAVFHPESGRIQVWDEELERELLDTPVLDAIEQSRRVPVLPVASDDPLMLSAVAEARRRWPEFLEVFQRRHPEQHFAVKAPIYAGPRVEHIWIEVVAITPETIRGKLGNEPVDLGGLRYGDEVTIPTGDVEDWIYVLTDKPVGGFTVEAVNAAQKRQKKSRRS